MQILQFAALRLDRTIRGEKACRTNATAALRDLYSHNALIYTVTCVFRLDDVQPCQQGYGIISKFVQICKFVQI